MAERKYLYLNSDDSKQYYPNNTPFDFTVKLSDPLELPGKWKLALSEIHFSNRDVEWYVYCELCESNNVMDYNLPILRRVHNPSIFENLYFLPINSTYVDTLRIYIRNRNHAIPSVDIQRLNCTLILENV